MNTFKQFKSTYHIKHLPGGICQISCRGRKSRSAIHFGVGFNEDGKGVFEKAPKGIIDNFEIGPIEGSFALPTNEELIHSNQVLEDIYHSIRSNQPVSRTRRIIKAKASEEAKHTIRYSHIRKLYCQIGLSMADIADHFKMSRVTIRKILNEYKKKGVDAEKLDNTTINRSKSNRKYSNELEIIHFMKSISERKDFRGIISVSFMIEILKAHFGPLYDFRRSKVAEMMKRAGLGFKSVKLELVKSLKSEGLNEHQKVHLCKLVHALASNKLLIFLDETYVSRQMVPKRIWARKDSEFRIKVTPKDDKITIVAASTLYGLEAFQVIYDSIGAVHYCIFLLRVREKLLAKYPGTELIFVHDNARPHIGKICANVFDKYPFIRQSAYSPRLNFIEYFFGFFKKSYRIINFANTEDVRQEKLVRCAIENVKDSMFSVCRRQFLGYCLKTLKEENLLN